MRTVLLGRRRGPKAGSLVEVVFPYCSGDRAVLADVVAAATANAVAIDNAVPDLGAERLVAVLSPELGSVRRTVGRRERSLLVEEGEC